MSGLKRRLVTENSNLRKLKFGSDQPGGGSSKQPFIREPLPGVLEDNPNIGLLGGAGEYVGLRQGTFKRTEDDLKRLSTFLLSTPQGAAFIAKQNILSATNVKSVGRSIQNQGTYSPTSTLAQIGVAGIGGHALKQGLNPFKDTQAGGDSSDPTLFSKVSDFVSGITDPLELPLYLSHQEEIKNVDTNRLVSLKNNKLSNTEPESSSESGLLDFIGNILNGGKLNLNLLKPNPGIELFKYSGGPGSAGGIGSTIIRRYSNSEKGLETFTPGTFQLPQSSQKEVTNELLGIKSEIRGNRESGFNLPEIISPKKSAKPGQYIPSKYNIQKDNVSLDTKALGVTPKYLSQNPDSGEELTEGFVGNNVKTASNPETLTTLSKNQLKSKSSSEFNPQIKKDFREDLADKNSNFIANSLDYANPLKTIEGRVNLGNPGGRGNRSSYVKGKLDANNKEIIADKINALQLYQSDIVVQNNSKNDLCDFRISVIDPNTQSYKSVFLHFRAFINSFEDSMSSDWQGEKYMGRGENFYRYNGFDRSINMSFTAAAQSKGEMMPMYNKLNYLQSAMAPNYTPSGYYFGNLIKMHVGAYLYDVPGVLTSLNYTIPQQATWEIAIGDKDEGVQERGDTQVLPHIIDVSLTFKPFHNFAPKLQANQYEKDKGIARVTSFGEERFISLSRGKNNGYQSVNGVDPNSGLEIPKKDISVEA